MDNHRKPLPNDATAVAARATLAGPWSTPPWTLEERLHRIEALGQKIGGYVQFMCQVANLNGASAEVKEKSVSDFYERLVIVERQLGRIHENLRLQ